MKKHISILLTIILTLTLSACIRIYMPSDNTDTDTDKDSALDQIPNNTDKTITIEHKTQSMGVYTYYDLGLCYIDELQNSTTSGNAVYCIIKSYEHLSTGTEYGKNLDKDIFNENYILAIKLNSRDTLGFIGFKNVKTGTARNIITVINDGGGNALANQYFYVQIPKEEFNCWKEHDFIEIRKETVKYSKAKELYPEKDFPMSNDGELLLISREEMMDFLAKNNLFLGTQASLPKTPMYIACYSKNKFGDRLSFTEPVINGNTILLNRDYNLSEYKNERPFLHIIPVDIDNEINISKIELTSRMTESGEFKLQSYQTNNTAVTYKYVDFYKTFGGGVYYGTELADRVESSYTVIENHREMLNKTEFYIDEAIFQDNYVLVLKLVGDYRYRLGFANAHVGLIDAMEGAKTSYLEIEMYKSPYYDSILNDSLEDKKEEILEESIITTEYEYIVVPKAQLNGVRKTGTLNITVNEDFRSYNEPYVTKKAFDNSNYSIVSGNTWRISTKLEMNDFNEKFGTNYNFRNLGYGKEYLIIYLEQYDNYEILQTTSFVKDSVFYLSYLSEEKENSSKTRQGYFYCLETNSSTADMKFIVENTVISYGSYKAHSKETEITAYDHYVMTVKYNNKPDWKYKVLTDYNQFEEAYSSYKYESEENITADMIFSNSTFDTHYVVAFLNYYDANVFYNARISGDKILHIYAFSDRDIINDLIEASKMIFIAIPKSDISTEIVGIKIQYTKEVAYNGPFEYVTVSSQNQEDVTLEKKPLVINSYEELQGVLENYEEYAKLRNVDFENNIILAFNRRYYTTSEYLYGKFVNFRTSIHGTASITFMSENQKWLSNGTKAYVLDLVIIPKEYIKHEIKYLYISYAKYSELFELDEFDRLLPDIIE